MEPIRAYDLTKCRVCQEGLLKGGPAFYRVTLEQHIVDRQGMQRALGLEQMLMGNGQIAKAMGGNPPVTHQIFESSVLVCATCAMNPDRDGFSLYHAWPKPDQEDPDQPTQKES